MPRPIGKLRIEMARILQENGYNIQPENIYVQEGHWRKVDCFRWFTIAPNLPSIGGYQTIKMFVALAKAGGKIVIDRENGGNTWVRVP